MKEATIARSDFEAPSAAEKVNLLVDKSRCGASVATANPSNLLAHLRFDIPDSFGCGAVSSAARFDVATSPPFFSKSFHFETMSAAVAAMLPFSCFLKRPTAFGRELAVSIDGVIFKL